MDCGGPEPSRMTDEAIDRPKGTMPNNGGCTEQEVRELLKTRYPCKIAAIASMRESWKTMPPTLREQADKWLEDTRSRSVC